jgi:hypothetical protein
MLDVKQLIAEVAARNGIRIDADDPAFCLVTLNQLVLEQAAREVVEEIRMATREFEQAAETVHRRAGMVLAQANKELLASIRHELATESGLPQRSADRRLALRWATLGVLVSLVLFACGVLVGISVG